MKKAKWLLSVFLTITMLMSSFVAAVGETFEEEQPAPQTAETDGGSGGGGHDHTTPGEGGEYDNTGTGEGGEHDNTGTDEGEIDPIDSMDENGDEGEGEELMLPGAAFPMAAGALLDEGMQLMAIEPAPTQYVLDVKDKDNKSGTLTLEFEKQPNGTYTMSATLSDGLKNQNSNFDWIIIYDSTGNEVARLGNAPWQGNNSTKVISDLAIPEDGWIEFSLNGNQAFQVGHTHNWVEDSRSGGSCMTPCTIHYKCACGETQTDAGPTLPHNMVAGTPVAPTCLAGGYTPYSCSYGCGTKENRIPTPAVPHDFVVKGTPVAPTCLVDGYTPYSCSYGCGTTKNLDPTPATGHSWQHVGDTSEHKCGNANCTATEPHSMTKTGSSNGVETWKCLICGYTTTKTTGNPVNPVNPGNGLATIDDEQIPLGLDMIALRMLDENLRITNSLTLGDVLNDNLIMVSALAKDGYILELNFGALQYLSTTYP